MAKIGNDSVKRVVLIGAESTGKTTMASHLARHYDTVWSPEYLRIFVDHKGGVPEPADIPVISRRHLEQEAAYLSQSNRLLFIDTDLITALVYSRFYFNYCPEWIEQASVEREADLYLLCDTDIPWEEDDDQRDGPVVRETLQKVLHDELVTRGLPFVVLSGSIEERKQAAVTAVDALITNTG